MDLFNYAPRTSHVVHVGNRPLGGDNPLRLQSMTTTPTADVAASVRQVKAIADAGADYVRLTTQGTREAQALGPIREALRRDGYDVPLVADVHFNARVADVAATLCEKVRINPGNYVDPARTFKHLDYTDAEYAAELARLEARLSRLLAICRRHHTALRIGVNHGSLSDRIMSRYGDTPAGIVESCMEFLRVCRKEDFEDVVVSIKASNTGVMVRSVRLLCRAMEAEDMDFPLHLGVTEAGEGEDGRIKSAVGIGTLLADGIGDTLRVSLSEPPEREIPVAYKLASYATQRAGHPFIPGLAVPGYDVANPERRPTAAVLSDAQPLQPIGGSHVPVVIAYDPDGKPEGAPGPAPDYAYTGRRLPDKRLPGVGYIVDAPAWRPEAGLFPAYTPQELPLVGMNRAPLKFLFLTYPALDGEVRACLRCHPEMVVLAQSHHANRVGELRALVHELWREGLSNPVVAALPYALPPARREELLLQAAADFGSLLLDGLLDGLMIQHAAQPETALSYAILQATRRRMTRTEYISCPGCGRTLYDLPGTIARIKAATAHLTGLKIGIMGCIVNGPGEMADADYGYVGAAPGKVSLYKGKTCVERNIPEAEAVSHLLRLIEENS